MKRLELIYQNISLVPQSFDKEILNWCLEIAEKRVTGIVSNLYRNAYERAALLTAACTEVLELVDPLEASRFFNKIKNKFPRHPAFQAELRMVRQK